MSNQLKLNGLNNTRDLCGMRGADGRKIRSGKLIRSGHLFFADASDLNVLKETVGMIVDFRTARERKEKPDPVIPGVRYMELPVLTESTAGITREEDSDRRAMTASMRDPDTANEYMCGMYRTIGSSDYCAKQYEQFVKLLLEEREKALLWHCTAGKDRAGFGAVIVQELLGVSREDIYEDYLMTNTYLKEEIDSLIGQLMEMLNSTGPQSEHAMRILFGAEPEYLNALYQALEETYGGMDRYLRDILHVSDEDRERLRELYLE